ncbi:Rap1a/Tai family immunity protein [Altererythrobacter sp. GH1-8]|uniref:Rap1a/Tai family immunity protein n=1 Tax=Altererythrobacter sp. GH1-8 TaxID=3349333 RepID=UPI00374CAB9D
MASVPTLAQTGYGPSYETGNDLSQSCKDLTYAQQDFCRGFVFGLAHGFRYQVFSGAGSICIPVGVASSQLLDVVMKYIRENPEKRHLTTVEIVQTSLSQAFPCS